MRVVGEVDRLMFEDLSLQMLKLTWWLKSNYKARYNSNGFLSLDLTLNAALAGIEKPKKNYIERWEYMYSVNESS